MTEKLTIYPLSEQDIQTAVEILCQAFYDYPVMRYIINSGPDYDKSLKILMHFFAMARLLRGEKILACGQNHHPDGVALVSHPDRRVHSTQLSDLREKAWQQLGAEARSRYESLGTVWSRFTVEQLHLHLNMVGVRPQAQGKGIGRCLIEYVQQLSHDDPHSTGLTLTTEDPANVPLYKNFGYTIIGQAPAAEGISTWIFFRPDS